MKKVGTIIFNLVELIVIILFGCLFKIELSHSIMLCFIFFLTRATCGKPMHYKDWYRCAIWSCLTFLSLYLLCNLDLFVIILLTFFTALITTGKADITDMFMWKGNASKNEDVAEYIKLHPLDDKLIEFEEKLKKKNDLQYMIYKYRFRDGLTFQQIEERLDVSTQRISEELSSISLAIRLYCDI